MGRTNDMEYYEEMIQVIASHVDFGKRNPVDIGMECGYSEEEVVEMIRACSEQEEDGERKKENICYFVADKEKKCYIASVDIDTWKIKAVKEIKKPSKRNRGRGLRQSKNTIIRIKSNIYVRVDDGNRMALSWENLDTGEHGRFLTDSAIEHVLIRDQEIIVLMEDEIVGFGFHGERRSAAVEEAFSAYGDITSIFKNSYNKCGILIEGKNDFYYVNDDAGIWKIDKEFKNEEYIEYEHKLQYVIAAEYIDNELFYYTDEGNAYTESDPGYEVLNDGEEHNSYFDSIFERIRTKNYCMHEDGIYSGRNGSRKICDFKVSPDSQVIGIFDKDIFIGVTDNGDCIKIDLQNERTPVILPVELD